MHYNQACAAKGEQAGRGRHWSARSLQRATVNIYKTDKSYEMLVFAPGRIKEHFKLDVKGDQLSISYNPPEGFARPDWILREYSRGGFQRLFTLDENIEKEAISASYVDGVLHVSLPVTAGKESSSKQIVVS